jgi:hypothetical protein
VVEISRSIAFPDLKEVLGRYLGPSIDVGPAMTAKILKANSLTEQDWVDEVERKARDEFDEKVKIRLGGPMSDFYYNEDDDVEDMTKYDLYEDDNGENHRQAQESDRMEIRLCQVGFEEEKEIDLEILKALATLILFSIPGFMKLFFQTGK